MDGRNESPGPDGLADLEQSLRQLQASIDDVLTVLAHRSPQSSAELRAGVEVPPDDVIERLRRSAG